MSISSPIIAYFIFCNGGVILCDGRGRYVRRPSYDINSGSPGGDKPAINDGAAYFDR